MEAQRLQDIVAAIRAMNITKKPKVGEFEKASGLNSSGKEIDEAWTFIAENPVDDDIPQTDQTDTDNTDNNPEGESSNTDDETNTGDNGDNDPATGEINNPPQDSVTVHIALSPKAIKKGIERRCRAGHCFDKTGKTFSAGEIEEDQIRAIAADPFLFVKIEG